MRNAPCTVIILIIILSLTGSVSFADGLGGWLNVIQNNSRTEVDGEKTSGTDTFRRNLYLNLNRPINPMISYQLSIRTNWLDSDSTDADDITTTSYRRTLEPTLDLSLRNPVYDVTFGYRRQEQWTNANLDNASRETTEFYYSRFNLSPRALPSLFINLDRQNNFDYGPVRSVDSTSDSYSINSGYDLPSKDVRLSYNMNYTHTVNRTPLSNNNKTINDSFSGNYNAGYTGNFWDRKASYTIGYRGNYSRNKNRQFLTETGSFIFERTASVGLYDQDTDVQAELGNNSLELTDDVYDVTVGNINLSTTADNQTGILILFQQSVDRLYIYVDEDISGDTGLNNVSEWRVYRNNFNQAGGWTEVAVSSINITAVDALNDIYRYEIIFSSPQTALFYKAINQSMSTVADVEVTEIEAYGTDDIQNTEALSVATSFTQGLNLTSSVRPVKQLNLSLHYSVDRSDQNPSGLTNSMGGLLKNIFSNSISGESEDFRSNVSRNYGVSATWYTHRLLTTILRLQRNDSFDNVQETDSSSNTYNLSLSSVPLPTLDLNFSLIRSERYSFDEKESTNDSVLFSVGSRLYRDVNMITDLGYTRSKSFSSNTTSQSYTINGSIDARITRKLTGALNYAYDKTDSDGSSTTSKDAFTVISYQMSRLLSLTGNFNYSGSEGNTTTSEGLFADWLPLPAVRLNMNYQHSDAEPGPSISDTLSGYIIWYITKFADVRFSYSYSQLKEENTTENYNFGTNLNCRF